MTYYIGQALGIVVTIGAILTMQIKNRKPMLIVSAVVNVLSALNILLLDKFSSGVIICLVAVLQIIFSLMHEKKGTEIPLAEKIVFFVLYVAGGILGFEKGIDVLSIIAAVLYKLLVLYRGEPPKIKQIIGMLKENRARKKNIVK